MSEAKKQPSLAAFEVTKGTSQVMMLNQNDVKKYLDPRELLDALEDGFRGLELGEIQSPPRSRLTVPGKGLSLTMPAWRPGMQLTVKIVNVFDGNLQIGLPNHLALITLFDPNTGATSCIMDGTYVTAIRTAAAAALSIRLLGRADSKIATVIGAGVQGCQHLRLLPLVRNVERINICSLRLEEAQKLATQSEIARAIANVEEAVRESDIVCLATHSPEPVIESAWLKPGTHVTSVGFHPPNGELPKDLARDHRLFVETLDAFQPTPVGCSELADLDSSMGTTLGAVILSQKQGRRSDGEITVYKAMGVAMEDMVAANLAFQRAKKDGVGNVTAL
ncbi:MAG TPA: ornithine cyclodeaminase family protein [Terriglobales bacterium]|jgi:alanine dehydrogenase|nr:ornithine cyclodeaminase family protein [Terriglobales bacterium]